MGIVFWRFERHFRFERWFTVIGAFLDNINDVARGAEVAFFAGTDTAIQASTVAGAIAAPQTNNLIANDAGKTSIAHTAASSSARTVARAPARAVRLSARSALPAGVADAEAAALTYAVAAAVVELLTSHHLLAVHASEPEPTVGRVICASDLLHLLQRVCVDVADLVRWPHGQAHDDRKRVTDGKTVATASSSGACGPSPVTKRCRNVATFFLFTSHAPPSLTTPSSCSLSVGVICLLQVCVHLGGSIVLFVLPPVFLL